MSRKSGKPLIIILVMLVLLVVGAKPGNLAWAGPNNQTVPSAVPTDTPTATPTEEPTAIPTNTATLLPTETATLLPTATSTFTQIPPQAPPDTGDQGESPGTSNIRTIIGIGILTLLGGAAAVGAFIWWFFGKSKNEEE